MLPQYYDYCEVYDCTGAIRRRAKFEFSMFGEKGPVVMDG